MNQENQKQVTIQDVLDNQPVLKKRLTPKTMKTRHWYEVLLNTPNQITLIILLVILGVSHVLHLDPNDGSTLTHVLLTIKNTTHLWIVFPIIYVIYNGFSYYLKLTDKNREYMQDYIQKERMWHLHYVEPYFEQLPHQKITPTSLAISESDYATSGLFAKVTYDLNDVPQSEIVVPVCTDFKATKPYVAIATPEETFNIGTYEHHKDKPRAVLLYAPYMFIQEQKRILNQKEGEIDHDTN